MRFVCLLALTILLTAMPSAFTLRAAERPNVLWIYLEDVSGWFSCYGETLIETPNIDDLAGAGTRFTRFYTPAGVCSATRSAIVTGMMQTSIGAHNHRSCRSSFRGKDMGEYDKNVLPADVVPLPIRFRQAGYWTFNEGGKDDYNFEFRIHEFYDVVPEKRGWGPAAFLAGDCWQGKPPEQPFFGQIQLGGGKLGKRAPVVIDRDAVRIPPYYPDVPEVREEIAHHYDCLLETDRQVGEIIAALKRSGQYENTVIFLFSDHGMKLHRHKQFLYEGGIHMPLIVLGGKVAKGKVRNDLVSGIDISAASLSVAGIDVPDSMEGRDFLAANYTPREYVIAARDRCDYTIEKIRAVVTPRFKYLRNYLTDRPYMQPSYKDEWAVSKRMRQMMADGEMNATQQIFFGPDRVPEELYDLENDPDEIANLADNPDFATQLEHHRRILADWIAKTGDKGQQPESDIGLECTLKRWGEKCVNPEYARIRKLPAATGTSGSPSVQPVRMGCGIMTFDTVPGWGLRTNGSSALGPTHGGVVVDEAGNVFTSANKGVVVFAPDGTVIRTYEGKDYTNIHDLEIRKEEGTEYLYGARNNNAEGLKFNAHSGEIVLRLPYPKESGLGPIQFNPTAITVAPNGDIFLANGYASNHIFKFDRNGKYLMHFGEKGNETKQFNTAHGMTLDRRYDPPRLLICDRNHQPKGRLVHYDLGGNFIEEVITGLGMPTSAAIQGDYVSVPDLLGRLVILDKSNSIMAVLGYNPDPKQGGNFNIPQDEWIEGIFSGTHGSYWDADGNLYVQDWNVSGRIMKLIRVRTPLSD